MIYFNITNVPAVKNTSLFYVNSAGDVEGLLVDDLNDFIN
jgi:hypothetical protein